MKSNTQYPVPKLSNLIKAFALNINDKEAPLFDDWKEENDTILSTSRTAWSLLAIALFRIKVKNDQSISIWFPDYFCNSSIAPLREINANLVFYPILRDGSPDIEFCSQLIPSSGKPDLFVGVHFFGKHMNMENAYTFAKQNDAWLVEDSAHILIPDNNLISYGHFVLFSPHKFLAIPDGAFLVAKADKLLKDYSIEVNPLKSIIEEMSKDSKINFFRTSIWVIKRTLQKLGIRRRANLGFSMSEDPRIMNTSSFISPPISKFSKKLLIVLIEDLKEEIEIRKQNEKKWKYFLKSMNIQFQEIFESKKARSPYLFGIELETSKISEELYRALNLRGIPVSTWPDLPPELDSYRKRHEKTVSLRMRSLFFPIHSNFDVDRYLSG